MGTPLLSVASLAVYFTIGAIASDDGVQSFGTVTALEAFAMPLPAFGQAFFCGIDYTTTTRATLSRGSLDSGSVNNSCLGGGVTISIAVTLQCSTTLAVAVTLGSEFLAVTHSAVYVSIGTIAM